MTRIKSLAAIEQPTTPVTKPVAPTTVQPAAQPVAQPVVPPTAQPAARPAVQPAAQPATQLAAKSEAKPVAQPAAQPTTPPAAKPEAKPAAQPAAQPTTPPAAKPDAKPAAQPAVPPAASPMTPPAAKPTASPVAPPAAQPAAKPEAKPAAAQPAAQPASSQPAAQPPAKPDVKPELKLNFADMRQRSLDMARLEAQISRDWDEYQERPKRKFIGARTEEYRFSRYVEDWRNKVERVGNLNYPEEARRNKIYGSLALTVSIKSNGEVENIEISRSSGHKLLDAAAERIVRLAAPYAVFPENIRRDTDIVSITRTWTFTKGDQLMTEN